MSLLKKVIYQWLSKRFMGDCSSYNSLEVRRSCRSKEQARRVFSKGGVPHAQGFIFFNPWRAHRFARDHGFPLVIKPNVSGFSRGSYFPITNFVALWKAIFLAKLWWPTTVVEQFLHGKNYRVLVAQGEIVSVIERFSPFVVGDGVNSIRKLIDEENATREAMGLFPCIYPLSKGEVTKKFLQKNNYNLDTVPPKNETVKLFYRISLAPGGVVSIIDKSRIPEVNKKMFLDVLDMFDANILGIDVILEKGITHSIDKQECIFLEVNSRPYLKMHDYPRFGEKEDLGTYFSKLDQLEISEADLF